MTQGLRYPHFLCIGAQKSGTNWLTENLRTHRGIYIPLKEIRYFNTRNDTFLQRCRRKTWKDDLKRRLSPSKILHQDWARTCWLIRYFFFHRTDAWYASLFRASGDRRIGDLTPAYSILEPKDIRHVADLMPDARIIYLLRNPVERAWSQIRMDHSTGNWPFADFKGKSIEDVPLDVLRLHMDGSFSTQRGDYMRSLRNWREYFPASQISVHYFEEIQQHPIQLLNDIARFIGIELEPAHAWPLAMERISGRPPMQLPPTVARHLSAIYIAGLRELETTDLLANRDYVKAWRLSTERLLA